MQLVDTGDDLVAPLRVEMDAIGLEQSLRRGVVALRLDPLDFGEKPAYAFMERHRIRHHVERLAVALAHVDRLCVRHQPADDHLAIPHVVLFELGALAHPTQLKERSPRVRLVLGTYDVIMIVLRDEAEFDELGVRQEVQRDQVGARLLDRKSTRLNSSHIQKSRMPSSA